MKLADDEHDDKPSTYELIEEKDRLLAEFGIEVGRTSAALERMRCTWDTGLREAVTRLDQILAHLNEAAALTRTLAAHRSQSAT